MASQYPPKRPEPETLNERADRTVEEARQWNKDLRQSVQDAKAHAKAMADARERRRADSQT